MIVVVRIRGEVNLPEDTEETLFRLRLRKKFSCIVVPEKQEILGMIKKAEDFVAYGKINEETLNELIEKRGKGIGKKKIDVKKAVGEIEKGKITSIKPFFSLHPPRGGFKKSIKEKYPKGVLGYNEKINELIKRML